MYNKNEPLFYFILTHAYQGCQSNLSKCITWEIHMQSQGDTVLISHGKSACRARDITSCPSLQGSVCSARKAQGLWRPLHFPNSLRRHRKQTVIGKANYSQTSTVKKQCLYWEISHFNCISDTIPARSRRWFILVDICRQVMFIISSTAYIAHNPSAVIFFV